MTEKELEAFTASDEDERGSSSMKRCLKAVPCISTLVELFRVLFSSDVEENDG
eukprot:CAMPEP_0173150976 /NCGR_PEP_ID=MMETSP1105-20130129/11294_1 /TAXON_ID=2985 /ORGANISM="Ochromonas sp., Strain BG-1" /LENGTH=52 /DNA_ID=CAMNT_0014066241 /DNA_START=47 /DNA_END=201 /DNA_ORIENTATION=+